MPHSCEVRLSPFSSSQNNSRPVILSVPLLGVSLRLGHRPIGWSRSSAGASAREDHQFTSPSKRQCPNSSWAGGWTGSRQSLKISLIIAQTCFVFPPSYKHLGIFTLPLAVVLLVWILREVPSHFVLEGSGVQCPNQQTKPLVLRINSFRIFPALWEPRLVPKLTLR